MPLSDFRSRASGQRGAAAPADFIDVRQLIWGLSNEDLLASADAYFAGLTTASEQCRKPFSNVKDAPHLARHLALLLEAADLFPGADVVDFGCATGWLTLGLSRLGCCPIGLDVSPAALRLAESMADAPGACGPAKPRFLAYDGQTLPLPDESVDRIVCFDAFHHVRDQQATMDEFARVLRRGGSVSMMEPGPHHSRSPQSQEEMRAHKVIENDVCIAQVAAQARRAGLDVPQMLVQFQRPLRVSQQEFSEWAESGIPGRRATQVANKLARELVDAQCFSISKGPAIVDSRMASQLGGSVTLLAGERRLVHGVPHAELRLRVRNTGVAHWWTGSAMGPGIVKLGVQLAHGPDAAVQVDYIRVELPAGGLEPGGEREVTGLIPLPESEGVHLRIDLVSEHVAWFSQRGGCVPVDVDLTLLPLKT
jgi:ubiquinone/menaquinone biosynthesis C-methylase UbiE